jgi:hypothetical protein
MTTDTPATPTASDNMPAAPDPVVFGAGHGLVDMAQPRRDDVL